MEIENPKIILLVVEYTLPFYFLLLSTVLPIDMRLIEYEKFVNVNLCWKIESFYKELSDIDVKAISAFNSL